MRRIFFLAILLLPTWLLAQKGTIRGMVYDDANGESLVGVSVVVVGTTLGTITDLDGQFSLDVPAGTLELQLSYISYNSLNIKAVAVKQGEVTVLNNLRLKESSMELNEVVISAEIIRTTEMALQTVKRKSASMMDGISAARIAQIGDATAVEAVRRVTGVSIEGGKYVYVRGLGDRYTKTTLNGVSIPGLDPDRNSLQMDIFPSNLINNMLVIKNFTAELPADFTGGLLDIEMKDFPDKKIVSASIGTGYNPAMHFNSNYLSYDGGFTDFLGFDDGTRALPELASSSNIPTPVSGASKTEVSDFIKSFNPTLGVSTKTSLMDFSASFSYGNQIELKNTKQKAVAPKLGYIFSLSYKSDYKFYDDVIYGEYQRVLNPDVYEMQNANLQTGQVGEYNVLVGLLGGVAYKTQLSKYKMMLLHLQNGESRAGKFMINNNSEAVGQSGYIASSDNLEYNQRSLTNLLFSGSHLSKTPGWEVNWKLSPVYSISNDPDIRKTAFTYTEQDTLFMAGAGGNPARIWRYLNELNVTAALDVARKFDLMGAVSTLKFGGSHVFKYRSYEILFFDIQFFGSQNWSSTDPNSVLSDENIYPNRPNSIYYQSGNSNPNPNEYQSNIQNSALYVSNEWQPFSWLKTVVGLRGEYFVQRHTGRDQRWASGDEVNGKNLDNDVVLESIDLFPSINLIFTASEMQNVRLSYTRTIARPSFKELSFAQILDPISNRIFNGSLFTYSDWDGNLTETRIDNLDFRWELFQEKDQMYSVSLFYKLFDNPIELVRIPEQQTSTEYQPRNVGDGSLLGLELEFRKDLGFVTRGLEGLSVSGNVTLAQSSVEMTTSEYNSRKYYEKTGETIEKTRQMAGQSPYVVNAGLSYLKADSPWNAGIFYNVKGPTLTIVGGGLFPDIYMEPFHSINLSLGYKFGDDDRQSLDFKVNNLLNDKVASYYQSYNAANQIYSSYSPGLAFSFSYGYKF